MGALGSDNDLTSVGTNDVFSSEDNAILIGDCKSVYVYVMCKSIKMSVRALLRFQGAKSSPVCAQVYSMLPIDIVSSQPHMMIYLVYSPVTGSLATSCCYYNFMLSFLNVCSMPPKDTSCSLYRTYSH